MTEDLRIDSHKLHFHPGRISKWLEGKIIYPITVEISPSAACNHRCIFCGLDYLGYRNRFLNKDLILSNLQQMKERGVKAVVLAGEGEPLLNRDTPEIIRRISEFGLDAAMSTNGVLFTDEVAKKCLPAMTWLRFSVNGAAPDAYKAVHRARSGDFEKVLNNIAHAVEVKRAGSLNTTIGVQLVLLPHNHQNIISFAQHLKNLGVDYFTVKPYSQHPQSRSTIDPNFSYADFTEIKTALDDLGDASFQVFFRADSMNKLLRHERKYEHCLGIPFWAYIDANGAVWPCLAYVGEEAFCLGSLKTQSFMLLWESERCRSIIHQMSRMDISRCREICRLDSINEYLHQIVNPGTHVNFI